MEMPQSDPVTEWSSSGGQTGLEEPMWQLGLGESYPERPDEADCIYYLRTGFCGYGARCRFNHPRDRGSVVGAMRASGGEYPERMGQPVCQYYMRTGMCKFGASCKYHHPRQGVGSSSTVTLNIYGYPLRPGENECSYYVKTGQCKFGVTCKFHHPQPAGMMPSAPLSMPSSAIYPSVAGNWPVPRPPLLHPGTYGPVLIPPGIVQFPGWNPYQVPVNPVVSPNAQTSFGAGPVYAISQLSPSAPSYTGPYLSMPSSTGPLSSNQNEYANPEWTLPKTTFILSPNGLPLRPGAPLCTHYAQNGVCKFGPSCKFDHPLGTLSYSPSASSLVDMPVAPYPVGSSIATLAPSSSSSELRPSSNKDGLSTSMPSGSIGSKSMLPGSTSTSHI